MLMAMLSRAVSAWFAFLIPCYRTWKALSHRPLSDPDLERWAMYWTCVGAFVAFENLAEWFVSWLPFYWEFRTLFLLFLALPQTQGSTWFYNTYAVPFFSRNEADIDAGILSAQNSTVTFLQSKLGAVWEALWRFATTHGGMPPSAAAGQSGAADGTAGKPAPSRNSLYALGENLFHNYGPWAMGSISKSLASDQSSVKLPPGVSPNGTPQSTPTPTPGMQQRKPFFTAESAASSQSSLPPAFPTPTHY